MLTVDDIELLLKSQRRRALPAMVKLVLVLVRLSFFGAGDLSSSSL